MSTEKQRIVKITDYSGLEMYQELGLNPYGTRLNAQYLVEDENGKIRLQLKAQHPSPHVYSV